MEAVEARARAVSNGDGIVKMTAKEPFLVREIRGFSQIEPRVIAGVRERIEGGRLESG